MKSKRKHITKAIVGSMFTVMIFGGIAVASQQPMEHVSPIGIDNTMLNHAELIDNENAMLIGKEVQDDTPLTATKGMRKKTGIANDRKENEIVVSFADEVLQPVNITNFETVDNVTPEVIIPNGSAATFEQSNIAGWMCNVGDELVYQFEKYPSEAVAQQTLVVGYILDGVMFPGEKFLDLEGEYRHKVEKNGEYFIYVLNASSDPLSLKNGGIYILESEG